MTVRDLLTMSAGLPTDDPWGDRQQGLPLDAFAELLAAGPTFAWPPGVIFEYSNLGYGILGRVVTSASGQEYREFVRDRILAPLGMTSTGYLRRRFRQSDSPTATSDSTRRWSARAPIRTGRWPRWAASSPRFAISPSGWGVPRRVSGSRRAGGQAPAPAGVASRDAAGPSPDPAVGRRPSGACGARFAGAGYGYGLGVRSDVELGTIVSHGGGYPGFGTQMAWHPASGSG